MPPGCSALAVGGIPPLSGVDATGFYECPDLIALAAISVISMLIAAILRKSGPRATHSAEPGRGTVRRATNGRRRVAGPRAFSANLRVEKMADRGCRRT